MKRKRLAKSIRKYLRQEKARIRRQVLDIEEQKRLINELYSNLQNKKNPKTPLSPK